MLMFIVWAVGPVLVFSIGAGGGAVGLVPVFMVGAGAVGPVLMYTGGGGCTRPSAYVYGVGRGYTVQFHLSDNP